MCRWFAYISPTEPCLLEDVLITPNHAISKQVNDHYLPNLISHVPGAETTEQEITARNRLNNVDGFGVAWYTSTRSEFESDDGSSGSRPALYKHDQPPTNDANFHSICANTKAFCLMAHIRAATATAVVTINNHPFTFGRHTIMHNGVISSFLDIRREMSSMLDRDVYQNVHGTTDSEHMAGLYITNLCKGRVETGKNVWEEVYPVDQMFSALQTTLQQILALQTKYIPTAEANSLNVCVSDGHNLVAIRYRNHVTEQPPSLYWSQTAGVTLNRKYPDNHDGTANPDAHVNPSEHGKHVIVASEPSTYDPKQWNLIEKNHAVLVDDKGNMKTEKIEIAKEMLRIERSVGPG